MILKRLFDIITSITALLLLSPFFIILIIVINVTSKGGAFFKQHRIGLKKKSFELIKFRTMYANAEKNGQITLGTKDVRITPIGRFLRRFKLDELPQLYNVLIGEMSVVGPRPEVPSYVAMYTAEELKVLEMKPGLTDYASLEYINENALLENSEDPLQTYKEEIMPAKLRLNQQYIRDQNMWIDIKIIIKTLIRIIS